MKLWLLFVSFLQVGLFSVGGGYAAVPLIKAQVVDGLGWLSVSEFADLLTIAEMTPGPIAVNAATFVGTRIAGVAGAVIATIGCIAPSLMLVTLLGMLYRKYHGLDSIKRVLSGLRPAITALIASAFLTILLNAVFPDGMSIAGADWLSAVLFVLAFAALRLLKKNPILIMLSCGVIYTAVGLIAGT